jgi:hypothetical protein
MWQSGLVMDWDAITTSLVRGLETHTFVGFILIPTIKPINDNNFIGYDFHALDPNTP